MMVLAMNVCGDCSTDRDESGACGYRNEEASRNYCAKDLVDAGPSVGGQCPGCDIEIHAIQARHIDDRRTTTLRSIAVTAAESAS
jgi:hypothetical protein